MVKGVLMMITQFAPVLKNELIYGLKPELNDQLCSRGFICLELINGLDNVAEKFFRATIS